MKKLLYYILILFTCSCFGQVSSQVSLICGTNNQKALKYFQSANFSFMTNRLANAKSLFLSAVKEDSLFCDAWDNLSVCCRKMGHFKDAFVAGLHSLVIDSTNYAAWLNCGYSAYLADDVPDALSSFEHLQRIVPNNPEGYYGKGIVLYSIDSISEARNNIYKAEQKYKAGGFTKGYEVDLLKGFIEYKYGNTKEAQSIFENIYPQFKNNADLNYFLGQCIQINENNSRKSKKYIDKAKKLGYVTEVKHLFYQ
jgi:tetratricopeptide (TPR) repeat protein